MNDEIRMSNDDLPDGWSETKLEDIARDVTYGYTAKSNRTSGGAKMLRITDIQDNRVDWSQVPFCAISAPDKAKYLLKKWDLVFARTGATVGKSFLIQDDVSDSVFASYLIRVRCLEQEMTRYLSYFFNSPAYWDQITDFSAGIGQPNVNGSKLKGLSIPLAPLAEQKRIADKLEAVLGRVDACRARLDRVPALLKRFRQSVLASATSGSLTAEWRMTNGVNDALEHVEIDFEEASLSLPSSWKVTRADAVCSSVRDGTHDTPKYVKSGIPLVTSKNIRPAGIDFEGAQQISHDDHREISKRSKVDVGDVLFSMIGSVGHICIVETSREFSIKNVGLFKNNPGTVLPRYMFYWLQGPLFHQWLEPRLRGGNQKFASLGLLRESPVFLPPLPEQQEIVRRVEDLFAFADRIEARLATAQKTVERLTPATLAKAFRGELVPQDPNDEPASALLERLALQPAPKARAKRP